MQTRNYALVTAGYWAFTLTDGALRMLVLLHFNELGYSPIALAFLFLLYEFMGILTNLLGGWVGSRTGLNKTLIAGLGLQVVALGALTFQQESWAEAASVAFVMGAQALSGVAKDLTKMSSKSAVKFVAGDGDGALFRLVAILTGSKNALKGVGFFLGAALLAALGYDTALWTMAAALVVVLAVVATMLNEDIGRSAKQTPLRSVLSKSDAINRLSFARFFLFASRDIWFVVALPIFLHDELGWSFYGVGGFLAAWVIGYGMIQSVAPRLLRGSDEITAARQWSFALGIVAAIIAAAVGVRVGGDTGTSVAIVGGLLVFGAVFALNSSLHSYLILAYSDDDDVSIDVGFYYSANAAGRLVGTLLSGLLYLWGGLTVALIGAAVFVAITWLLTLRLPELPAASERSAVATG
ncbi:MAG: organoarsenical effux MFS transporter ArsJ [Ilumatobacter sp.]|uniref:organoarsenical effux MFS transporter ArsJ n=1 Tax=Ilumatobacter sp. TaxID=1967498 RepID=UPI003C78FB18